MPRCERTHFSSKLNLRKKSLSLLLFVLMKFYAMIKTQFDSSITFCTYIYMYVCMYVWLGCVSICVHICAYMYVCTYDFFVYLYVCIYLYTYVCVCVTMYVYTCAHTHTYTYTQRSMQHSTTKGQSLNTRQILFALRQRGSLLLLLVCFPLNCVGVD